MKEPFLSLYRNDIPCLTDYTEHGKINIVDEHHRSLLHHAIKLGLKDAFSLLIGCYIDLDIEDDMGNTCYHYAVLHNRLSFLRILFLKGGNPMQKNKEGRTPLYLACRYGKESIIDLYLEKYQLDMGEKDNLSQTICMALVLSGGSIPNSVLILSVACGVGFFLAVAMVRMLFSVPLSVFLILFYIIVFVFTLFAPEDFLAVAFDSGGVTTGPMTVPFIMALGIGFAAVRSDKHAEDDSFGLVALCSVGPILAVLLLGLVYQPEGTGYTPAPLPDIRDSVELWQCFKSGFPAYFKEIALSFFVPKIFTAIAFDSGGVASGPMTATFLLPFAIGACQAAGGDIVRDAFGIIAMVAMTPLIAIQILGAVYQVRLRKSKAAHPLLPPYLDGLGEDDIIEL